MAFKKEQFKLYLDKLNYALKYESKDIMRILTQGEYCEVIRSIISVKSPKEIEFILDNFTEKTTFDIICQNLYLNIPTTSNLHIVFKYLSISKFTSIVLPEILKYLNVEHIKIAVNNLGFYTCFEICSRTSISSLYFLTSLVEGKELDVNNQALEQCIYYLENCCENKHKFLIDKLNQIKASNSNLN
jgi:hypothetical protein